MDYSFTIYAMLVLTQLLQTTTPVVELSLSVLFSFHFGLTEPGDEESTSTSSNVLLIAHIQFLGLSIQGNKFLHVIDTGALCLTAEVLPILVSVVVDRL